MEMSVGRNEPCPCGSGKKYKKCCMNKQQVVDMHQAREERIAQQKLQIVKKLNAFIELKYTFHEYIQLRSEFNQRSHRRVPEQALDGYVRYWLGFFHKHKNGLKGIEWFMQEEGHKLQSDEKALADKWCELKPRLFQAVDQTEDSIVFEDVHTSETFPMKLGTENLPNYIPWFGTISLVEYFGDMAVFNGIRLFQGPDNVARCSKAIRELVEEHQLTIEETIRLFLPELVAVLLEKPAHGSMDISSDPEYVLEAELKDAPAYAETLSNQDEFVIYDWREEEKLLSQAENWLTYYDSYLNSEALLADSVGSLKFSGNRLEYRSSDKEKVEQFGQLLQKEAVEVISEIKEEKKTEALALSETLIQVKGEAPDYFRLYAKKAKEVEALLEGQETVEIERQLKQYEYEMYDQITSTYGEVEATFDWNSIRQRHGLTPSPFVTQGSTRKSSLRTVYYEDNQIFKVKKEDISMYEDLGFFPEELDEFYHDRLLEFYKLKTEGKGKSTIKKYRDSLFQFIQSLRMQDITQWASCSEEFWRKMLLIDFFEDVLLSQTKAKDLLSTMRAFTKWLDENEGTQLHKTVASVTKELEKPILEAVKAYTDLENPDRVIPDTAKEPVDLYVIEAVTGSEMTVKELHGKERCTLQLEEKQASILQTDMILDTSIFKKDDKVSIGHLLKIYPNESRKYL